MSEKQEVSACVGNQKVESRQMKCEGQSFGEWSVLQRKVGLQLAFGILLTNLMLFHGSKPMWLFQKLMLLFTADTTIITIITTIELGFNTFSVNTVWHLKNIHTLQNVIYCSIRIEKKNSIM